MEFYNTNNIFIMKKAKDKLGVSAVMISPTLKHASIKYKKR